MGTSIGLQQQAIDAYIASLGIPPGPNYTTRHLCLATTYRAALP
ncbi:hypothetical protein [Flavobacterium psychrophilum]|nr:hypothetical protein [Flavobacterium psychrophilum]